MKRYTKHGDKITIDQPTLFSYNSPLLIYETIKIV